MSTVTKPASMNEANERDPFNNSSYGTLVDAPYKEVRLPILDVNDFNDRIIRGYEEGTAECGLPADLTLARSFIPAGTATLRDFSYIAPDIPEYLPNNCTGCMDCVTLCPDTAILGKVLPKTNGKRRCSPSPKRTGKCTASNGPRPRNITTPASRRSSPAACSRSSSTRRSARAVPNASPSAMTMPSR